MSRSKICGVYKITHIASGKSYVGISKDIHRRWTQHRSWVTTGTRRSAIYNAMQRYGIDAFSWQIIEECCQDDLNMREQHWISVFDTFRNGYNLTAGGEYNKEISYETRQRMSASQKGKKHSQEQIEKRVRRGVDHFAYGKQRDEVTKKKISQTLNGFKQSDETKAKRAKIMTGRKMSPEAIEKSRIARTGITFTEQARKNLSESHKGNKHSEETRRKMSDAHKARNLAKKLAVMQVSSQVQ